MHACVEGHKKAAERALAAKREGHEEEVENFKTLEQDAIE